MFDFIHLYNFSVQQVLRIALYTHVSKASILFQSAFLVGHDSGAYCYRRRLLPLLLLQRRVSCALTISLILLQQHSSSPLVVFFPLVHESPFVNTNQRNTQSSTSSVGSPSADIFVFSRVIKFFVFFACSLSFHCPLLFSSTSFSHLLRSLITT